MNIFFNASNFPFQSPRILKGYSGIQFERYQVNSRKWKEKIYDTKVRKKTYTYITKFIQGKY